MQVGLVAPIRYLHLCSTGFYLCYADLLSNKAYLEFYKRKEGTIVLDFSPKLPRRANLDVLLEGVKLIKPTMVVLPSIDYSSSKTVSLAREFLGRSKFKQLIGVVQGLNLDTLNECYQFLRNYCSTIGLTSPLETIARRDEIIRDLRVKERVLYIEVYSNPYEEVPPVNSVGICTSFPVRLAADYRKLSEFSPTPPPLDFNKEEIVEELAVANIEEYLGVIDAGGEERDFA